MFTHIAQVRNLVAAEREDIALCGLDGIDVSLCGFNVSVIEYPQPDRRVE